MYENRARGRLKCLASVLIAYAGSVSLFGAPGLAPRRDQSIQPTNAGQAAGRSHRPPALRPFDPRWRMTSPIPSLFSPAPLLPCTPAPLHPCSPAPPLPCSSAPPLPCTSAPNRLPFLLPVWYTFFTITLQQFTIIPITLLPPHNTFQTHPPLAEGFKAKVHMWLPIGPATTASMDGRDQKGSVSD
jgi:hypothetical protein